MKQIQGVSGGDKTCSKRSNKKGKTNNAQKQQKSDKKENKNRDTNINNGAHLVDGKWMCLCNKGCGFYTSHTTVLHDTWTACVKNNEPFTLSETHIFENKMVAEGGIVTQGASNNGGDTQDLPPYQWRYCFLSWRRLTSYVG